MKSQCWHGSIKLEKINLQFIQLAKKLEFVLI